MTDPRTPSPEPQDAVPDSATVHLVRAAEPEPEPEPEPGYSATALDDHWFRVPGQGPTLRTEPEPEPEPTTALTLPDRVEGDVLRFGPGVTVALPGHAPADVRPTGRRWGAVLRRYALAAAVLAAVLAFVAWQRLGPDLAVRDVTVRTESGAPGCNGTAEVVGVVRTNGAAGTIDYRWLRSDGSESGLLHEQVPDGRREARLRLLWTFHGQGEYRARAELRIVSPTTRSATTQFTYACP